MEFTELVKMAGTDGMSIIIIAYFLYKDYRFNENIINVLGEVKEVLCELRTWHESEARDK